MAGAERDPVCTSVRDASRADLAVVASWIRSEEECRLWAGPDVSFPLGLERLTAEIGMDEAVNLALADDDGLVAFGQLTRREPRAAHLARVIVRPDARGLGLGHHLVRMLLDRAVAEGARTATLHVYAQNEAAVRVYEAAGLHRAGAKLGGEGGAAIWFMTQELAPPHR